MTDALPAYILDNAATAEYQRLDLMSKILDPWTRHYLGALGVGPGWQCLEVGSGNGSVAEWLCGVVGSSGSVTAVDINTVLLGLVPAQNLRVTRMDVRTGGLSANAYDLVSCRAFLHQVAGDAPAVLEKIGRGREARRMAADPGAGLPPRSNHGARGLGDDLASLDRVGA